jgi:hypothetical protein
MAWHDVANAAFEKEKKKKTKEEKKKEEKTLFTGELY